MKHYGNRAYDVNVGNNVVLATAGLSRGMSALALISYILSSTYKHPQELSEDWRVDQASTGKSELA